MSHTPPKPADDRPLRVLSINVQFGRADPAQLDAELRSADADVVVLLEVTDELLARPELRPSLSAYPYRLGEADPDGGSAAGTVVFSRTPAVQLEQLDTRFNGYVVRVTRPGGSPVTVIAAHPLNPLAGADRWAAEGAVVEDAARRYRDDPLLVVGDLNATLEHLTVRRLLALGLTSAADQAGAGWAPTFSTETAPVPPLIAIDHVLVGSRLAATGFRTFQVDGADHRGVVADLAVR